MTAEDLPISPGTTIRTTQPNTGRGDDRTEAALAKRKWGVQGIVRAHYPGDLYDSYKVRHEDGTEAFYYRSEFKVEK